LLADSVRLIRHEARGAHVADLDPGHAANELFYVDRGRAQLIVGRTEFRLDAGDGVIFQGRTPHELHGIGEEPLTVLCVYFDANLPRRLLRRRFRFTEMEREILAALKAEEGFRRRHGYTMALAKLNELLAVLDRCDHERDPELKPAGWNRISSRNQVVRQALAYLQDHLAEPLDPAAVAAHCGLSDIRVRALLGRETGKNLREHLRAMRVERACRLLRETSLNVKQIAEQVGYETVPHFCTVFKIETGMTPTEYARTLGLPTTTRRTG